MFQNGDTVEVYGKEYTVVGTVKRSYAVKNSEGKTYKVTAKNMKLIRSTDAPMEAEVNVPCASQSSALEEMLRFKKMWNKDAKLPTDEASCAYWFEDLEGQLSPEILHCDGEASAAQVKVKLAQIKKAWKELEKIQGKKRGLYY